MENVTFLGLLFGQFCTAGASVDVHVPKWSPPGGSTPTAIAVGFLGAAFAAGWLGAAGAAELRPAALAAPGARHAGEYCRELSYLGPHPFPALAAYSQFSPQVGVRHVGVEDLNLRPPL